MIIGLILLLLSFNCVFAQEKTTLLYGENMHEIGQPSQIWLFADQTFVTKYDRELWGLNGPVNGPNKDSGRYTFKNDTLLFDVPCFGYLAGRKAVIKDNFIEYLDGKTEFKVEVKKSDIQVTKTSSPRSRYSDYSFFTYSPQHVRSFSDARQAFDLEANEVEEIDRLLTKCIRKNRKFLSHKNFELLRQCIAVTNSKGEKLVWVNCLCKEGGYANEFKYEIVEVLDGGSCFFSMMINLTKGSYFLLSVNGQA